jgi:hypothetical protein
MALSTDRSWLYNYGSRRGHVLLLNGPMRRESLSFSQVKSLRNPCETEHPIRLFGTVVTPTIYMRHPFG